MKLSTIHRFAIAVVVASLTGCAGSAGTASAPGAPSVMPAMQPASAMQQASLMHKAGLPQPPCNLTPQVWASSLGTNKVYGYNPASVVCKTLSGPYAGLNINAPIGLAFSKPQRRLYVADLGNNRILVFSQNGVFIKWLSTAVAGQQYQPWGVCVSPKGIVGVANRQYNNTGALGNVEFFLPNAASGSGPTGYATGVLGSDAFCAFDRRENFFVDGTATAASGGGQQIAYLTAAHILQANQTLLNSGLGNASYWSGMYSRIDAPVDDTLSVGTSIGNSTTETVMNWKVAGVAVLAFAALPSYILTPYPATTDAVYQLAPSAGGAAGTLYVADYGDNELLDTGAGGGAMANYAAVSGNVGVTTNPTGQY
jgi:DNA-binding beta-propeller fold protein YncE